MASAIAYPIEILVSIATSNNLVNASAACRQSVKRNGRGSVTPSNIL